MREQLIKNFFPQRAQTFPELPRLIQRLSLADIAEQLEQRSLGDWYKDIAPAIREGLQSKIRLQLGAKKLRGLIAIRKSLGKPGWKRLWTLTPQTQHFLNAHVLPHASPIERGSATDMKVSYATAQKRQATVSWQGVAGEHVDTAGQVHQPSTTGKSWGSERTHPVPGEHRQS